MDKVDIEIKAYPCLSSSCTIAPHSSWTPFSWHSANETPPQPNGFMQTRFETQSALSNALPDMIGKSKRRASIGDHACTRYGMTRIWQGPVNGCSQAHLPHCILNFRSTTAMGTTPTPLSVPSACCMVEGIRVRFECCSYTDWEAHGWASHV